MSVHHIGGSGGHQFRSQGHSRIRGRRFEGSADRPEQRSQESNRTRSSRSTERSGAEVSDRYDRSDARRSRGGRTIIINHYHYYPDSEGVGDRGDRGVEKGDRTLPGSQPWIPEATTNETRPERTVDGAEKTVDERPAELSRRQSRRLDRLERQSERMFTRGFGDRAIARLERHLARIERRMDRGFVDAEQGQLYSDSLRTMISDLSTRMDSGEQDEAVSEDQPMTPFKDLPEGLQNWVRKFHSRVMGLEKTGHAEHAISILNERIEWANGKSEAGTMNKEDAANLVKTLEHIISRIDTGASGDAPSVPSAGAAPESVSDKAAESATEKWDWEPWKPERAEASDSPRRALPRHLQRWLKQYSSRVMQAHRSGDTERAQGLVQNRIDWVNEGFENGLIPPKIAANLSAVLERMMERVTPAEDTESGSGANPSSTPTLQQGAQLSTTEVDSPHRAQMYSYAASQYRLAS
ncbi:MAG: hypothetical protein HKN13_02255 [Rhodothermales bacterium]|nr:hypothetical protein [Rhodothermales bacterium]